MMIGAGSVPIRLPDLFGSQGRPSGLDPDSCRLTNTRCVLFYSHAFPRDFAR